MEIKDLNLKEFIENETGYKFNRQLKINSPFNTADKTPSFAIYYDDNADKWKFKDFSTGSVGDIIDFCMQYKDLDYVQAREYLGLSVEKTENEIEIDKIEQYINWSIENQSFRKGQKLLGIFKFVDENNVVKYYKAKFRKPNGSKELTYFSIGEDGKVYNKRNLDYELPYNLYNALEGINEGKQLIFVEGERDVNRINHLLKTNYVAISIKNCKEPGIKLLQSEFIKILVVPDNDEPGMKYLEMVKSNFIKYSSMFKIVNLPSIKAMKKGADITDWLEAGHTKKELLQAFKRSLDLKNKYEFQQDSNGIYKLKFSKNDDEENNPIREYITNFNILEASKVNKIDAEVEGIKLKVKSCIDGKIAEKIGSSKIFDDLRAFRSCLGMDFSFTGTKLKDLVDLKVWITKYLAIDNKEVHAGTKFVPLEGTEQFKLITPMGTISSNGIDYSSISEKTNINILDIKPIEKQELQDLMKNLFGFCEYSKAISIIGSALSFLEIGQNMEIDEQLHHLFIIGESQTGKTTILEKVVMPILNYPKQDKETMSSSPYTIKEKLFIGNYPIVYEEFKPSKMTNYKKDELSNIFRIAYDRDVISRGDKTFKVKSLKLNRPMIIAGEESIPGNEKAIVTRSCIVYLGKGERTEKNSKSMFWLMDHKESLNRLGKTLILESLNLPIEEYKNLRVELREIFHLKDRPLNTAVNISCGIELLNKVLLKYDLEPVQDYYRHIEQNIREEVLEGGEDTRSVIEQMLV
ncbi:DNA primase, partial [Clostridium botulinum]|nr:DNA primase [Clostridium botulinum]NFH85045.1 DNA primase [Clostridium botulinum]NFI13018.1 DNA primase [Clostridium botulinum]NFI16273.1 DNA primase [Clostridium botulinum]NFO86044.1 DNA primase [Clostridium botulinum]